VDRERIEEIEKVLYSVLPPEAGSEWITDVFPGLAAPPAAVEALLAPGVDLLRRGGKRWRPLLMTLVCEALGGGDNALPLTPLVEIPHNASLIHDDIEDNSSFRRGEVAVHIRYGVDTAINSGSFLYFLPLVCIERWKPSGGERQKNRVFTYWGEYLRRLHLGQAMDIAWHRDFSLIPSLDEYHLMCRLKTGSLARLAAVLGVCAATLPRSLERERAETLGSAAETLGVGFQILDDVKNLTTGNPGKKRGDDIVEGKKSLPVLLYLQSGAVARETVERCFGEARSVATPEVDELIGHLSASGALAAAEARGQALIAEAKAALTAAGTSDSANNLLGDLIEMIKAS
jgi:octaprenyl-diphosphate synthase